MVRLADADQSLLNNTCTSPWVYFNCGEFQHKCELFTLELFALLSEFETMISSSVK